MRGESKRAWVTAIAGAVVVTGAMVLSVLLPALGRLLLFVSVFVVSGIVVFAFATGENQ